MAEFLFNDQIFPSSLFDFKKFPMKNLSFVCMPTKNTAKFNQRYLHILKTFSDQIKNYNSSEQGTISFRHFHDNSWLLTDFYKIIQV